MPAVHRESFSYAAFQLQSPAASVVMERDVLLWEVSSGSWWQIKVYFLVLSCYPAGLWPVFEHQCSIPRWESSLSSLPCFPMALGAFQFLVLLV